jgi:hypothetical protein
MGLERSGCRADAVLAARVVPLHPLCLVEEEHADPCRPDHVLDHARAAVLICLVLEAMGLVDDEHLVPGTMPHVLLDEAGQFVGIIGEK